MSPPEIRDCQLAMARMIYCDGRPFSLLESKRSTDFVKALNPSFELPTPKQLAGPLLTTVFHEYKTQVEERLARCDKLNIIFDASENINSQRVLNVCVHVPGDVAYYWTTINTGSMGLSAANHMLLLQPILLEITGGDLARINGFNTDSCNTMKAVCRLTRLAPELQHCFWVYCDSHGLQLLIKDIFNIPELAWVHQQSNILINGFSNSKLQNARLREEQDKIYERRHALITR
jgi:hypothetical protein